MVGAAKGGAERAGEQEGGEREGAVRGLGREGERAGRSGCASGGCGEDAPAGCALACVARGPRRCVCAKLPLLSLRLLLGRAGGCSRILVALLRSSVGR